MEKTIRELIRELPYEEIVEMSREVLKGLIPMKEDKTVGEKEDKTTKENK